ncbi:biotin--[acetyl-CoA-carboxylase] ligase [Microcella humidisoli]|uniref:biotin--[biotin carboxyl-carrier protein] ligase n=1 Tax=Microcella humidisoli TaxID=2963406 RepID=A0ABY5FZA7_9MICO|nr:biotin--[acetyl-CoA-carboxylase] ligase [Microcella humidisoli]UTT63036.1 biotin--[acetyl-CoA-carboxylase] ligase [Microcella humidisoli]
MLLPLSRAISPSLDWRERCASTNSELVARAELLPDLAVVATADQTAGRGRLGRVWSAPPGSALAVSLLVRHDGAPDPRRLGWLPLMAGVALARTARSLGVEGVGLKWPNDVLVDAAGGPARKLSGILTELATEGVVVGAGLNLSMTADELPVPTATSLALQGVPVDAGLVDRALAAALHELLSVVAQWRAVTDPAELRAVIEPELRTLGRAVRVDRPGLAPLLGTAESLDDDGRLRVRSLAEGEGIVAVAAGDVTHLRYE